MTLLGDALRGGGGPDSLSWLELARGRLSGAEAGGANGRRPFERADGAALIFIPLAGLHKAMTIAPKAGIHVPPPSEDGRSGGMDLRAGGPAGGRLSEREPEWRRWTPIPQGSGGVNPSDRSSWRRCRLSGDMTQFHVPRATLSFGWATPVCPGNNPDVVFPTKAGIKRSPNPEGTTTG